MKAISFTYCSMNPSSFLSLGFALAATHLVSAAPTVWSSTPAEPAKWEVDSLPIGNGRIGALLFGDPAQEFVHFNENSLWLGDENDTGSYQSFGNFTFDLAQAASEVTDYKRELDLDTAIHTVSYSAGGTKFTRQAFASKPANIILVALSADRPGAYTGIIKLNDDHAAKAVALSNDTLEVTGTLKNGMAYASRLKVVATGGKLEQDGNTLKVTGANALRFYLAAGTNYIPDSSKKWRGDLPAAKLASTIDAATKLSPAALRDAHIADHQKLFRRTTIDLGASDPALEKLTTRERLLKFWETKNDPDFEELVFQFGRYCLIASSRPSGLPANLQGIWNRNNNPPWRSDYHSDINVDMNYWLSNPTNLSELQQPFFDYVISQIPVATANTKKQFNTRGWNVQYENGIHGGGSWRWNHSGSSWFAQQFWTHYSYTLDKKFLKEQALPVFRGVCEFWEDWLIEKDGTLIAPKGWSPEYGPTEDGVTYDQQFAWDAFSNYIDTCRILGVEKEHADKIEKMRAKLMPLKIGKWGQLQEWMLNDRDKEKEDHRHLSHLIGLYPGRQIDSNTPELFAAAKKSLIARGDEGAGWTLPWKAAIWARYRDGEHARAVLTNKLKPILTTPGRIQAGTDGTSPNLFTIVWSVLQIDGTLGYPAAVTEMLMQSNEPGKLDLLPALPDAWKTGSIKGFKARGGHIIEMKWKDGELISATVVKGPGPLPQILVKGKAIPAKDARIRIVQKS